MRLGDFSGEQVLTILLLFFLVKQTFLADFGDEPAALDLNQVVIAVLLRSEWLLLYLVITGGTHVL